jgi:hypothetical protein
MVPLAFRVGAAPVASLLGAPRAREGRPCPGTQRKAAR